MRVALGRLSEGRTTEGERWPSTGLKPGFVFRPPPFAGPIVALLVMALFAWAGLAQAQGGDPQRGAQLFAENCAMCHGPTGQGRVGPNLSKTFSGINVNVELKQIIANGVKGAVMPAWSQANGGPLSDQDIDDIIAYINTWGGGNAPVAPAPTPVPVTPVAVAGITGDATRGAQLFAQNCAGCHGSHGQGRVGATLQKDWPGIQPGLSIRQTIANGVRGAVMPAWSQANGGPLSDQDINDITVFILSLQSQPPPTPQPAPGGAISGVVAFVVLVLVAILVGGLLIIRPIRHG